jgi:DNA-binding beta-propeller fold protein YncE
MRTLLVALAFLGSALLPAGAAAGPSKTIAVGAAPMGIAFARGSAWVAVGRALVRLDGASGRVLGRTPLPAGGDYRRVAIAGGRAWVTDGGGAHGSIVVVDLATRRVVMVVRVACCALGISARGGRLVVTLAHDGPGELARIDPATGAIVSRTTTGPGPQPPEAAGNRVRGGGALWIAHFIQGTVTRVPLARGA